MIARPKSLCFVVLAILVAVATTAAAEQPKPVEVTNFPPVQTVDGAVEVTEPVSHGKMVRLTRQLISPQSRVEALNLLPVGTVEVDGFTDVVLSLQGETKGAPRQPGEVGAILVPDEEAVVRALEEEQLAQFPLEVTAAVQPGGTLYFAAQEREVAGFPSYRVYLYNTTGRSAEVNLYLYLTH